MKAILTAPFKSLLAGELFQTQKTTPVPVASSAFSRPTEIKRYVRYIRETRHYNYTRDFLY